MFSKSVSERFNLANLTLSICNRWTGTGNYSKKHYKSNNSLLNDFHLKSICLPEIWFESHFYSETYILTKHAYILTCMFTRAAVADLFFSIIYISKNSHFYFMHPNIMIFIWKKKSCFMRTYLYGIFDLCPKRLDAITDALIYQSQFGGIYWNLFIPANCTVTTIIIFWITKEVEVILWHFEAGKAEITA